MNAQTISRSTSASSLLAILLCAGLGACLLVVAGHVQASTLHDAAHDVRHATGFPCH